MSFLSMAAKIQYGVYKITPEEGEEYVGARKTLGGAQGLAARLAGARIYAWFARSKNGFGEILSTEVGTAKFRIERGWF